MKIFQIILNHNFLYKLFYLFFLSFSIILSSMEVAVAQLNEAEIKAINSAAQGLGLIVGNDSNSNFSDVLSSIDCSEVSCKPEDLCRYINLGSNSPVISNYLCEKSASINNGAVNEDTYLLLSLLSNLPKPQSCQNESVETPPLTQPGTIIVNPDPPAIDSSCLDDLNLQFEYVKNNKDDLLSIIKSNTQLVKNNQIPIPVLMYLIN